jgi:hypothetical protein
MRTALPRKTAVQGLSFAMASIGLGGASVVATNVKLVGRRSARQPLDLIIDSSTVVLPSMKWRLSALKDPTSPPSLESNRSHGTQCIVGSKERLLGVAGSIVER